MPRENLIGQKVAEYKIVNLVGEGGTSTVYRAEHGQHGTVALKILREKLRADKTAVARFLREAKYGTRVVHPNVVRTIEIGEAHDMLHYLSTEWAPGDLLEKYAKRSGPLPPEEVAEIVCQIADAVQAAHSAGIVHRDLKPENVMYDPEQRLVKLLDFGIAVDTEAVADERLTRAGFFVGTLMYVAPEALSGELVSFQADQYSLATIAYYLLTGTLPYTAKTPREMFTQLLSQPPQPINQARRDLDFGADVERVVMRALSRDPNARYADTTTFATELKTALLALPQGSARAKPAAPAAPSAPAASAEPAKEGGDSAMDKLKSIFRFGR